MAHLLIWGDTRGILAGGAPPGTPVEEVRSLAALQSVLDGRVAGAMVLADPHCLEAEREKTETWLRNGGSAQAFLVTVADADEGDEVLNRLPFVDDVLVRPVTSIRLLRRLERGMDIIRNRRVIRQLEEKLNRRGDELSELNKIGVALSAERDIDKLLELILQKSREITGADAGSLYLVERGKPEEGTSDRLRFKPPQNDSVPVSEFQEYTIPLDETSIAGYVALTGSPVNVPDAYYPPKGSPYTISRSFDEKSRYRSKSMLVVPMRDHDEVVIGVIQLINTTRNRRAVLRPASLAEEEVITFTSEDEKLASSLASQAAVAFENADLIRRIRQLFDKFIEAAVTAVEQRDPPTSDHSRRVAVLTVGLAKKVDAIASGPLASVTLTPEQLQELRYAALLHDFGKVAVQEKFLRKKKKLYAGQMTAINQRFAYILKCIEADHLRAQLGVWDPERPLLRRLTGVLRPGATAKVLRHLEDEYRGRRAEVERLRDAVIHANEPTVLSEESFSAFVDLPARRFASEKEQDDFPVEAWAEPPYLSSAEVEALSVRRGSLTHEEKERINEHVQETYKFLIKIPWTGDLKKIPEIAWAHHEKLDGSGYPRKLTAAAIPPQSRMMTIADIYDALLQDRYYKKAVPPETALAYLEDDVRDGLLDGDLLRVFIDAKVYDLPEFRTLIKHGA
jgi:HD-GYP domain-containing protein (c-di-GMP phosphodiesterase class II)